MLEYLTLHFYFIKKSQTLALKSKRLEIMLVAATALQGTPWSWFCIFEIVNIVNDLTINGDHISFNISQ